MSPLDIAWQNSLIVARLTEAERQQVNVQELKESK